MSSFRKRPVVIDATQWFKNGDHPDDESVMFVPVPGDGEPGLTEGKVVRRYRVPGDGPRSNGARICVRCEGLMHVHGWIDTLEGGHIVCPGDFIITGVKGERYPCKPDIFALTYEEARAIAPGVVVRSKSGGLPMTVETVDADLKICLCVWFDRAEGGAEWTGPFREKFAIDGLEMTNPRS